MLQLSYWRGMTALAKYWLAAPNPQDRRPWIHFMFGSRVGFSGSVDRMTLFPVTSNPSWRQAAILDNFEWPYLRNGSFDPVVALLSLR